jgi:phage gp29-like protein
MSEAERIFQLPRVLDHMGRPVSMAAEGNPPLSRRRSSALRKQIGTGGVAYTQGLIDNDEFNSKLTGSEAIETYDKMRRTDAQVSALISAVTLPLLSAEWEVVRPPDKEEAAKITDEHLEFCKQNLFTRLDFPQLLRHFLTSVWAGFSWAEKVYELDGGKLVFKKVDPRLASTLDRWQVNNNGELTGIEQEVYKDGGTKRFEIPRDKIALFVFQQEANNYEGMSLLRPVYKHWYIKDTLYRIDAIRHERFAIGVPVITLPEQYDETLLDQAEEIGENWRGAEQAYAIVVEGMKIELLQVKGSEALDISPTIQHHNEQIALAGLAQFLSFGTTQTGSRNLGEVTVEFFYDAEEGLGNWVSSALCEELLYPLLDLNFREKIRPIVAFSDLGAISLHELIGSLKDVGPTYVHQTLETENYIRDKLNMPEIDQAAYDKAEEAKQKEARTAVEQQLPRKDKAEEEEKEEEEKGPEE